MRTRFGSGRGLPIAAAAAITVGAGCGDGGSNEVTADQFRSVEGLSGQPLGDDAKPEVRRILGEPEDTGSVELSTGPEDDCWFYSQSGRLLPGADPDDQAAVCFSSSGVVATQSSFAPPSADQAELEQCLQDEGLKTIPAQQFRGHLEIAGEEPIVISEGELIFTVYTYASDAEAGDALQEGKAELADPTQIGNVVISGAEGQQAFGPIQDCVYEVGYP